MSSFINQVYNAASKLAAVGSELTSTTKRHAIRRTLPVHPQHLFNIILQVDAYSSFLPLCTYSRIIQMSPCKTRFDATLKVGITGLPPPLNSMEEEYTSRVSAKHSRTRDSLGKESLLWTVDASSIQSKYLDHLKSHWILKPIAPSYNWTTPSSVNPKESSKVWTDVDFTIEMSMSDPILTVLLDQILKDVATRQVLAFEKRCFDIPFVSSGPNQDM